LRLILRLRAKDSSERAQKIHELTDLVMTLGNGEYPMIFSNDSEYTYYGHFRAISTPERVNRTSNWASCTLTFACSDPKGYGEYQQQDMTQNPIKIYPAGNGECYPVFTCMPKKDVTKIAITDENGTYVYLGADVDPDTGDAPIDKEPLVLHDECNTLATWTEITNNTLTFALDNGVIGGTMQSTSAAIKVGSVNDYADFGSAVSGKWHGPCRLQWLPNSYSDYRIKVGMYNRQYNPRARGKSEVYLIDSNGARIAHISLKDNGNSEEVIDKNRLKNGPSEKSVYDSYGKINKGKTNSKTVKLGAGTKKVTSKGKTKTVQKWKTVKLDEDTSTSIYTDFYGFIQLEKIGNKFKVEIMKMDDNSNPSLV
jgi:hypothetical protein